jgi:hypothetical protein
VARRGRGAAAKPGAARAPLHAPPANRHPAHLNLAHLAMAARARPWLLLALACLCARGGAAQAPRVRALFLPSAGALDLEKGTVTLPLQAARGPRNTTVHFVVTEASTPAAAAAWGAGLAAELAGARGTAAVQRARVAVPAAAQEQQVYEVPATVDFRFAKRSVTPNPTTAFPPTAYSYSAKGDPGD